MGDSNIKCKIKNDSKLNWINKNKKSQIGYIPQAIDVVPGPGTSKLSKLLH